MSDLWFGFDVYWLQVVGIDEIGVWFACGPLGLWQSFQRVSLCKWPDAVDCRCLYVVNCKCPFNSSCHIWKCVVTYEWSCHTWMIHLTHKCVNSHMNESCYIWRSNESCYVWISCVTYKWVTSHMHEAGNTSMSHVTLCLISTYIYIKIGWLHWIGLLPRPFLRKIWAILPI